MTVKSEGKHPQPSFHHFVHHDKLGKEVTVHFCLIFVTPFQNMPVVLSSKTLLHTTPQTQMQLGITTGDNRAPQLHF